MVFDRIIYHANCPDGTSAAWVIWKYQKGQGIYTPCKYGESVNNIKNQRIAIVDFSFPKQELLKMSKEAKSILILDHHESAQTDLKDVNEKNIEIVFDMKRSGCQITWDYFYKSTRPWFLEYVADRDLGNNALPNTREISQALFSERVYMSFDSIEKLYKDSINNKDSVMKQKIQTGKQLLVGVDNNIADVANNAVDMLFLNKYKVKFVECPRHLRSDVGRYLYTNYDCDFAALHWYDISSREHWLSLRAKKDCIHNLSNITASLPRGGGHPGASGFTVFENQGDKLSNYFVDI